jgi:hypothetical protein
LSDGAKIKVAAAKPTAPGAAAPAAPAPGAHQRGTKGSRAGTLAPAS